MPNHDESKYLNESKHVATAVKYPWSAVIRNNQFTERPETAFLTRDHVHAVLNETIRQMAPSYLVTSLRIVKRLIVLCPFAHSM